MIEDEILGGLRNALEHGESLEKAVQSFINAGYNPRQVKAAANQLSSGSSTILHEPNSEEFPAPIHSESDTPKPPAGIESTLEPKELSEKSKKIVVSLIVLFIILIALLILALIFQDKIIDLFSK